jgi:hypothetical protein
MEIKKVLTHFLKFLGAAALCCGLYLFCEKQTQGFRPYLILSNLPNDPRWEIPPLSTEEQNKIDALLDQPFTFLGSGGWCYAFLGKDQKTVLKFFRHTHLSPLSILKNFSFDKLLFKSLPLPQNIEYFQEFNFNSCMLLWNKVRERSGLIYVHLNKTRNLHKPVTLIDSIGVCHQINLDKTEFVIQKKAELLIPHLASLIKQQKIEETKSAIDDMLNCLLSLYKSGVRDHDTSLRHNFGYTDDGAITLDLSSFGFDESLKDSSLYKKEIVFKTKRLKHWLKKYHPDLFTYYEERLNEILIQ